MSQPPHDSPKHRLIPGFALALWRKIYWWNYLRPKPLQVKRAVRRLVAGARPIFVELGSARRAGMDEWTTLDLNGGADIRHDLTRPLPFPDASVDRIYSSHVFEHFTYPSQLLPLLRECYRVLKPGATISCAVPNARLYLTAYFHPETFDQKKFCGYDVGLKYTSRIDVVNFVAYLGGQHKFLFDEVNLPRVLAEAGFRNARLREYDPRLDMPERVHESLYAEAVR